MISEKKQKLSNIFIWLGLLAWVPYIGLRIFKIDVIVIPFLAVHLTGVIGGVILRRQSGQSGESDSNSRKIRKKISTVLLILGISVWGVYFLLEWITGVEREVTPFLIAHLSGVLSGAGIKVYNFLTKG